MALVKLELLPLPDLREIGERLWFKIKLDSKAKWRPDGWLDPARDEDIQAALQDSALTSIDDRIKHLSEITGRGKYECGTALREGKWRSSDNRYVSIATADFPKQVKEPVPSSSSLFWFYRNRLVKATGDEPLDELSLRIRHKVLSHEKALDKVRREVEAFENFEKLGGNHRAPIPHRIQMFVWQRDGGKCVKCGSVDRLEFDHIIPLAKGGSNTERNIQFLCEGCNRLKGSDI
jgi:hypothetical protein